MSKANKDTRPRENLTPRMKRYLKFEGEVLSDKKYRHNLGSNIKHRKDSCQDCQNDLELKNRYENLYLQYQTINRQRQKEKQLVSLFEKALNVILQGKNKKNVTRKIKVKNDLNTII